MYATALDQVRRSWRRQRFEIRYLQRCRVQDTPAPEEHDTALWRAVAGLSARARTAVAVRYVADLSEAEIAEVMKVTRGTHRFFVRLCGRSPPASRE